MYKCKICSGFSIWVKLSRAVVHEGSSAHIRRHRDLDRNDPPTSPADQDPYIPSAELSESPPLPLPSTAPIISSSSDSFQLDDLDPAAIATIPGPALPGDNPDEIYDNWGGAFGMEMAMSEHESCDTTFGGLGSSDRDDPEDTRIWGLLEDPLEWEQVQYAHNSDGE